MEYAHCAIPTLLDHTPAPQPLTLLISHPLESLALAVKQSQTLFYAWHYYGAAPPLYHSAADALRNAQQLGESWELPTFATEFMGCDVWNATARANVSRTYWHYSSYCTTGPAFGNRAVPNATFGACILGWAGASTTFHQDCKE